jgi:hypothetical protein
MVLLVFPFLLLVFNRFHEIRSGRVATISTFSSDPNAYPAASRFIITMTSLTGALLASLLIEEYNSRCDGSWLFFVETGAAILFPLVGIFHTKGARGSTFETYAVNNFCGKVCEIPLWFSDAVHTVAALTFMGTETACNLYYACTIYRKKSSGSQHAVRGITACAIISLISFVVMVVSQAVLYLCEEKEETNQGAEMRPTSMPKDAGADPSGDGRTRCEICDRAVKSREICPRCGALLNQAPPRVLRPCLRHAAITSFISESLLFLFVLITTILGTLKRNNAVNWMK